MRDVFCVSIHHPKPYPTGCVFFYRKEYRGDDGSHMVRTPTKSSRSRLSRVLRVRRKWSTYNRGDDGVIAYFIADTDEAEKAE